MTEKGAPERPVLDLSDEARARLKKFHDDGLVWLVNTAVLHPRGLALAIHLDTESGEALGLSIVGDGDEPWIFGDDQVDDEGAPFGLVKRYMASEAAREAAWSPKLRGES